MDDDQSLTPDVPRARLTSDERRRTLLEAASAEFARVGFQGASTSRIALRAGCSEPMLYKHFSSKQSLFVAVLRDSVSFFQRKFDEAIDKSEDVRTRTRQYVTMQMRDPSFLELLHLRMLALSIAHEPEVRDTLVEIERRSHERIRAFVEHGITEGHIHPDTDPEYVAWGWFGLMLATCYRNKLEPGTYAEMVPHVTTFIETTAPR